MGTAEGVAKGAPCWFVFWKGEHRWGFQRAASGVERGRLRTSLGLGATPTP